MGFNYKVTDDTPDKKYMVWEYLKIKQEYRTPGVYMLFDITGEVLYIGKSGSGTDMVGDRDYNHIMEQKNLNVGFRNVSTRFNFLFLNILSKKNTK